MSAKKIPLRQCVGCVEMKPKKELIRVVKNKEGQISLDLTGKAQGRGAYVCNNPECLKKAIKAKRLERVFGIKIEEEIYLKLQTEIESNE